MNGQNGAKRIVIGFEIGQIHLLHLATDVGEWRDRLVARNPGWNEVLNKASKAPGSKVSKI